MKLTNNKPIVMFSAETTDCYLGPRMKMFFENVTIMYTAKKLRSTCDIK